MTRLSIPGETIADRSPLTTGQVWRALGRASFAVISHTTPAGEPRSSGVLYRVHDRHLYLATDPASWKARHLSVDGRVAVTVPVRRGGLLSLVAPIPPATVSFHGTAVVHPAGTFELPDDLAALLPPEVRGSNCLVEIVPEGSFVTYGVDVPLLKMRDRDRSRARVPVA